MREERHPPSGWADRNSDYSILHSFVVVLERGFVLRLPAEPLLFVGSTTFCAHYWAIIVAPYAVPVGGPT